MSSNEHDFLIGIVNELDEIQDRTLELRNRLVALLPASAGFRGTSLEVTPEYGVEEVETNVPPKLRSALESIGEAGLRRAVVQTMLRLPYLAEDIDRVVGMMVDAGELLEQSGVLFLAEGGEG